MATTIGKLNFMVSADSSGVITGLSVGESAFTGFASRVTSAYQNLRAQFELNPITQFLGWGVKLAAEAETAKISFTAMLHSGELATTMLSDLRAMGKETPFEFGELRQSAQTLIAFGESSESILPTLKMLGDISAGSGKRIDELTLIFGQAAAAGRLMTQDMNQLTSAGIPILGTLADRLGVTKTEVRKLVEEGKIDFETFTDAMRSMTEKGGLYFGQMDEKSRSLAGRWSTLKDTASELALQVGERLVPTLKQLTETGIVVLDWVKNIDVGTAETTVKIVAMTAAFAAAVAITPKIIAAGMSIVKVLRAIAVGESIAQALSGPKGWVVLAAGLAAAAGAGFAVNAMFDDLESKAGTATEKVTEATTAVNNLSQALSTGVADSGSSLTSYVSALRDEITKTKTIFDRLASSVEAKRGQSVGAAGRFTAEGFSAVQSGLREDKIQSELRAIREAEARALRSLEDRVRAVETAIKEKSGVKVREVSF